MDLAGFFIFQKKIKRAGFLAFCQVCNHFEFVSSASRDTFLMAFRRFAARRERCSTVYCDDDSSFVGAASQFNQLDWNYLRKYCCVNTIDWKSIPSTAA